MYVRTRVFRSPKYVACTIRMGYLVNLLLDHDYTPKITRMPPPPFFIFLAFAPPSLAALRSLHYFDL